MVDDDGNRLEPGTGHGEQVSSFLVLDRPWLAMLRGIWTDPERFTETYWSRFAGQGLYFAAAAPTARSGAPGRIDDT